MQGADASRYHYRWFQSTIILNFENACLYHGHRKVPYGQRDKLIHEKFPWNKVDFSFPFFCTVNTWRGSCHPKMSCLVYINRPTRHNWNQLHYLREGMSSLRLALKLSMVEAPAGSTAPRIDEADETFLLLEKQIHKRKRKMSLTVDDQPSLNTGTHCPCISWSYIIRRATNVAIDQFSYQKVNDDRRCVRISSHIEDRNRTESLWCLGWPIENFNNNFAAIIVWEWEWYHEIDRQKDPEKYTAHQTEKINIKIVAYKFWTMSSVHFFHLV